MSPRIFTFHISNSLFVNTAFAGIPFIDLATQKSSRFYLLCISPLPLVISDFFEDGESVYLIIGLQPTVNIIFEMVYLLFSCIVMSNFIGLRLSFKVFAIFSIRIDQLCLVSRSSVNFK